MRDEFSPDLWSGFRIKISKTSCRQKVEKRYSNQFYNIKILSSMNSCNKNKLNMVVLFIKWG